MNAPLRTDLNEFLFATVTQDASGMTLTVLSALARNGVDPWDEAAELAGLPRDSATQRLASMLAKVPNGPAPGDETSTLATRLVALLHRSSKPRVVADVAGIREAVAAQPRDNKLAIYYLIAMIVMLAALWVFRG